jgi:hypothetical protein
MLAWFKQNGTGNEGIGVGLHQVTTAAIGVARAAGPFDEDN